MDKIKLNLFNLKSKDDLIQVRDFFSKNILRWFNDDKTPKDKYFEIRACPLLSCYPFSEILSEISTVLVPSFAFFFNQSMNSLTPPWLRIPG